MANAAMSNNEFQGGAMPTIQVTIDQLDHSASQAHTRTHSLVMDRPQTKGGQDKGPMGGEALLMGLGGCFMSNLLAAAIARDIQVSNAQVEILGELANAPPRYTSITMKVSADCNPEEEFEKLVTIAERGCIVANTLGKALDLNVICS